MTATATQTADWTLVDIRTTKAGEACGHCGRTLQNLYDVRNTATGETMTVGRGCCKAVTGWTLTLAEARAQLRYAQAVARRGAKWAAFAAEYRALAAVIDADAQAGIAAAHATKFTISDRPAGRWDRECAQNYINR